MDNTVLYLWGGINCHFDSQYPQIFRSVLKCTE